MSNTDGGIALRRSPHVWDTLNLSTYADSSSDTKEATKKHRGTPYTPWTCPNAEHPTHRGPAPPRNTLLTVDLHHRGTPYLSWTWPNTEHPSNCGPASARNTLLNLNFPHCVTPYSPWTCSISEHSTTYRLNQPRSWFNEKVLRTDLQPCI